MLQNRNSRNVVFRSRVITNSDNYLTTGTSRNRNNTKGHGTQWSPNPPPGPSGLLMNRRDPLGAPKGWIRGHMVQQAQGLPSPAALTPSPPWILGWCRSHLTALYPYRFWKLRHGIPPIGSLYSQYSNISRRMTMLKLHGAQGYRTFVQSCSVCTVCTIETVVVFSRMTFGRAQCK